MARIHLEIIAVAVLSIAMMNTSGPVIAMDQQKAPDESNVAPSRQTAETGKLGKRRVPAVAGDLKLTVEYLEFDVLQDQEFFAAIDRELSKRRTDRNDREVIERLRDRAKPLKELRSFVPVKLGQASEATGRVGDSTLRVKLTSVTAREDAYAIMADLERWDKRNGIPEFTCGIHRQELNLNRGNWQVASVNALFVGNPATNKLEVHKMMLWIVHLSNDAMSL